MRVVHISDTHNWLRQIVVPAGDVLVHSGDATRCNTLRELRAFAGRMHRLPHRHKIFVPGNHDGLVADPDLCQRLFDSSVTVLIDAGVTIEGVHFYGMPWVCGTAGNFNSFTLPAGSAQLANACRQIPENVDVLVTHGPAEGILDKDHTGQSRGCHVLRRYLAHMQPRENPRYHLFGHVHASYGGWFDPDTNICHSNSSVVNEHYQLVNLPQVMDI